MKRIVLFVAAALLLAACDGKMIMKSINISAPEPKEAITKVSLSDTQKDYVNSGNAFAFKCLDILYRENRQSVIFSPLSLQLALAMTVNGASGNTAEEIINTIGYGSDIDDMNEYCHKLITQLPAVDKAVNVKITDAMLIRNEFKAQDSFKDILNNSFYAPLEYFTFKNKKDVAERINKWAYNNTNGFIRNLLSPDDIDDEFVAAIMNALYFKAKWAGSDYEPMFTEEGTMKKQPFYLDDGGKVTADLMRSTDHFPYARRDGYQVVSIPYSNGHYAMYVLLPDEKGSNGVEKLVSKLADESWSDICSSLNTEAKVYLRLPKFESENKFCLNQALQQLGINLAFGNQAEFDRMFDARNWNFWIGAIFQKARIAVTEWGTEAAAVTVVLMDGATATLPRPVPEVYFYADHPFVYVIAEKTSGTILFEGVFNGK
ncbi:MAG: serpin family protein [Bacteroidales bacterium]|nr:serpin family protein [Bacteroidales bacterium]